MAYLPLDRFWAVESLRMVVRTSGDLSHVAPSLRALVSELDSRTPVSDIRTFGARLGEATARPRFAAYLLAGFAGVALFLAAIGVYGVLSYAMQRRVPEIGVRLALGASGRDVFVLLFGRGLTLTLAGVAIGLPLAFGATRFLSSLLFGVEPVDTTVFTLVPAVLLLVGLAAAYVPARRAARVDPMQALRLDGQ
jgi:ABC-type antimicrobial peptide transport system permease subunit